MSRFTQLAEDVHTTLSNNTVSLVIGNDKQRRRGAKRRVHWYRRGGPIVPHSRAGASLVGAERIRTSFERQGTVECHIFAEDDNTIEDLCDNLIAAIWQTVNAGDVVFMDYDWDDDEINQRGPYVVLRFMVKYPVNDEISPLTVVTDTLHSCMIETPVP